MRHLPGAACLVLAAVFLVVTVVEGFAQEGIASWYGKPFHGRKTASGVTYDMEAPMCAHRRMKFGTEVRITNLANGRQARCVIRDRGPYIAGRVIDVSHLVANQLGMLRSGVARVSIAVME